MRGEAVLASVSTDTRAMTPGSLFVALRGPNHDGHRFLAEARRLGAGAALVQAGSEPEGLPVVAVADTPTALLDLAAAYRLRHGVRLAAITGSCGKTTVKELLASILRAGVGEDGALVSPGNWNNTIGLPLSLLGLGPGHRFAALEAGINRPGEMARLAATARPDVVVLTNAGPAHLAGLGSVADVAAEKGLLLKGLDPNGVAVINADCAYADIWARSSPASVLRYGLQGPAEMRGSWVPGEYGGHLHIEGPGGSAEVDLALPGRHNASNALAAAAAARSLGLSWNAIRTGLAGGSALPGRLQPRGQGGVTVLDDTYNANPASLEAALAVLAEGTGRRWLVLGDMQELGDTAEAWHRQAGESARRLGVDRLLAVGELAGSAAVAFGAGGEGLSDRDAAAARLEQEIAAGDRVLLKGSRAMQLDRVAARLTGVA